MSEPFVRHSALGTLLCLVLLVGCSSSASHRWSQGSSSTTEERIDATVQFNVEYLMCDERLYFVVVDNGKRIADGCGAGPFVEQKRQTADGRDITWSCSSPDGCDGVVVFDGQTFALANGAVLFASSQGGTTHIEQLKLDMARLLDSFEQDGVDKTLRRLADREPVVARFLELCTVSRR